MTRTYRTLEGDALDLSGLTDTEYGFFAMWAGRFRLGAKRAEVVEARLSRHNPLLEEGPVEGSIVYHPLMQALADMGTRAGIRDGVFKPRPGDDVESDPFGDIAKTARTG